MASAFLPNMKRRKWRRCRGKITMVMLCLLFHGFYSTTRYYNGTSFFMRFLGAPFPWLVFIVIAAAVEWIAFSTSNSSSIKIVAWIDIISVTTTTR